MPHMGRRKFSMGGKLHGRNMLISEYIFVICIAVLGDKEIFRIDNSNDSIEQMGRKQVSSHMQVVKKFFEDLRCCMSLCLLCVLVGWNLLTDHHSPLLVPCRGEEGAGYDQLG